MRHLPDSGFNWILHCVDHWSKFNFLYPLKQKSAACVAEPLDAQLFPYFGVPRILHSDNGREFVNTLIADLLQKWGPGIQLVSGRPRHPQSQGAGSGFISIAKLFPRQFGKDVIQSGSVVHVMHNLLSCKHCTYIDITITFVNFFIFHAEQS